ncbi:glycosyltransferase [Reinekea sp.]|jgi:glycosyltransferase involved in cell wall biosynthesis|uniref:glycosyltransferase n=1 Tax=Reinekea sp. TaxID=1970455 RepID=UPI002A82469C|nr:glycosyltransferase [Reinekea sp.]
MFNFSPPTRLKVLHIISGDLWAGAEAQAGTLLKQLKPLCDVSAVLMNDGELANRLRTCGIEVTILDESSHSTWQLFKLLRSHIKKIKPNVIHTHRQKENILGALANATTVRARCIRTAHGAPESSGHWKITLQTTIERWTSLLFHDLIIAVSDDLKDKLTCQYPENMIRVVFNGVDIADLRASAGVAEFKTAQPAMHHIGIIGRLVPIKRVDLFLQAAALFKRDQLLHHRFHVIGDGPLKKQLMVQTEALSIQDTVTFHGHRNDVPSYINSLEMVVMCSDHEGMPMVALETLALGKILVMHHTGGLKYFRDFPNTCSFEDNTSSAIKSAILSSKLHQPAYPLPSRFRDFALHTFATYSTKQASL